MNHNKLSSDEKIYLEGKIKNEHNHIEIYKNNIDRISEDIEKIKIFSSNKGYDASQEISVKKDNINENIKCIEDSKESIKQWENEIETGNFKGYY